MLTSCKNEVRLLFSSDIRDNEAIKMSSCVADLSPENEFLANFEMTVS